MKAVAGPTAAILVVVCLASGCSTNTGQLLPMNDGVGVFLAKANNDLISHCKCEHTFIGAPAQMDCPWCGCGWLFICPKCRKAFTFARAERCELTWEQLAHNDLDGKYGRQPSQEEVDEWIGYMKLLTKDLVISKQYAYIDGWVFPVDEVQLRFEGAHARHHLAAVPQTMALSDRESLQQTLGNREYWDARRIDIE